MIRSVLIGSVCLLLSTTAIACSCLGEETTASDKIQSVKAIYLGKVVAIEPKEMALVHGQVATYTVEISVLETWKGDVQTSLVGSFAETYNDPARTDRIMSSCGTPVSTNGFIVLLTNTLRPVFSVCGHNLWHIAAEEVTAIRSFVQNNLIEVN